MKIKEISVKISLNTNMYCDRLEEVRFEDFMNASAGH